MNKWTVAAIFGGVALLWLATVTVLPAVAANYGTVALSRMGAFGDTFGAVNALFAGLGSAAVFIVLLFDLRHRRSEFRPFIAAKVSTASVIKARRDESQFHLHMRLEVSLDNITAVPAVNIKLGQTAVSFMSLDQVQHVGVLHIIKFDDSPLVGERRNPAMLRFEFAGDSAVQLLQLWKRGTGLVVYVHVSYSGVNGTRWENYGEFNILPTDSETLTALDESLRPEQTIYIDSQDSAATYPFRSLEFDTVVGQWGQKQITARER